MPRSLELYLEDLSSASDAIFRFTAGMSRQAYEDNDLVQAAVERCFSIIGEALAQMWQHYPAVIATDRGLKKDHRVPQRPDAQVPERR
jgi:uncharacterized protein with HEPN domain